MIWYSPSQRMRASASGTALTPTPSVASNRRLVRQLTACSMALLPQGPDRGQAYALGAVAGKRPSAGEELPCRRGRQQSPGQHLIGERIEAALPAQLYALGQELGGGSRDEIARAPAAAFLAIDADAHGGLGDGLGERANAVCGGGGGLDQRRLGAALGPRPGAITTTRTSAISATSISLWPVPTVSSKMTSLPAASRPSITRTAAGHRPPR